MRLYYDREGTIRCATTSKLITNIYKYVEVDGDKLDGSPIGKKIAFGDGEAGTRVAMLCNWGDACGIATYSQYLADALRPLVDDLAIFAERTSDPSTASVEGGVTRCWRRGQSMASTIKQIIEWRPTIVLIQHEFGIFPRAPFLLQILHMLDAAGIPYVVTLHSVYEHLDKVICSSAMKNIVVHSETGRDCLRRLGHSSEIEVIPHGCVRADEARENWNITHTPYAIMQFGFGFEYKGVDTALEAVAMLKRQQPDKYGGDTPIHYCYLCSESPHVVHVINDYYRKLTRKIEELDLVDNCMIIRGFQTEEVLNQYLRTYKLAVFPYGQKPDNVVYGASGAVRLAIANRIPAIVSVSHMFDDLEGVLPRAADSEALAREIDHVFSDHLYREGLVAKATEYVEENNWEVTAHRYLDFFSRIVAKNENRTILKVSVARAT